jgi:hypothetical protein
MADSEAIVYPVKIPLHNLISLWRPVAPAGLTALRGVHLYQPGPDASA